MEGDSAQGRTGTEKDGKGLNVNIMLSDTGTKEDNYIKEIGHEAFVHAEKEAEDFADDGESNLSNIDKSIVKQLEAASKKAPRTFPPDNIPNWAQHYQEKAQKTLNNRLLPILQDYYKNKNIKKSDVDIKKSINGYYN